MQVRNVKLFNKCYCEKNKYEELETILRKHGLYLQNRGDGTAWSEKVRGREWFSCSINLKWKDRSKRDDPKFCGDENRKMLVEAVKSALEHPVAINSPSLTCI